MHFKNSLPFIMLGTTIEPWKSSVIYLGSKFVEDCLTLPSVKHRICCAESVVTRLNPRVFRRRAIEQNLKGKFIESAVFGSLLYGLQYCTFSKRDQRCLDGYYLRLVKRVCLLPFGYHLSYERAQKCVDVELPSQHVSRELLRWTGHVLRSNEQVLIEVLTFVPSSGKRGRGRPRPRFYDTIKADLKERNIVVDTKKQSVFWDELTVRAQDRCCWRKEVVNARREASMG